MSEAFQRARHCAKQHPEPWVAVDRDIFAQPGGLVGTMKTAALAELVASMHNCFLPMSNKLLMALRRLKDVEEIENV